MCPGMCCRDLAGWPEYVYRAPAHLVVVDGDVNSGAYWHLLSWRILTFPESSHGSSAFSIKAFLFVLHKLALERSGYWLAGLEHFSAGRPGVW